MARGPVGPAIVSGLRTVGAQDLILPDTDLSTATEEDHATWAQPFLLQTGRGDVETAASDSQLTIYFNPAPGDGALAAYQLLANLAMLHFEIPGTSQPTRASSPSPPPTGIPTRPSSARSSLG